MSRMLSATRKYRVGALVDASTSNKLDADFMQPLMESFSAILSDVNNASVFIDKKTINNILDSVWVGIQELADRLAKLDAAEVADWKADVLSAQAQLNVFANQFAVYSDTSNQKALYSAFAGVAVGTLSGWLVYRRKKSRKWAVFAGTGAAAASGLTTWILAKPKFE